MPSLTTLSQEVILLAREKKITLAVAESVTGGKIADALTSVAGASEVFLCGIVSYSENSKIHTLGIPVDEIRKTHGYSSQTAMLMAEHIRSRNASDIGISTTGCAGPDACASFVAGQVMVGLSVREKETLVFDQQFSGNREEVRTSAAVFALKKVLETIHSFPSSR